jgi:tRNA-dihydrouridine synthase
MFNFWQQIPRPIIGLSPMDGVTDASFRYITAKHGKPDVTLTEFVNIQSAMFAPDILLKDFTYSEIERPIAAQIYGKSPELFYKVAHIVGELGFDGLDINMGCPAKKVAAAGCGAALIRTPDLAREIMRSSAPPDKESPIGLTGRRWNRSVYGRARSPRLKPPIVCAAAVMHRRSAAESRFR